MTSRIHGLMRTRRMPLSSAGLVIAALLAIVTDASAFCRGGKFHFSKSPREFHAIIGKPQSKSIAADYDATGQGCDIGEPGKGGFRIGFSGSLDNPPCKLIQIPVPAEKGNITGAVHFNASHDAEAQLCAWVEDNIGLRLHDCDGCTCNPKGGTMQANQELLLFTGHVYGETLLRFDPSSKVVPDLTCSPPGLRLVFVGLTLIAAAPKDTTPEPIACHFR